jgi:hypothetical protein
MAKIVVKSYLLAWPRLLFIIWVSYLQFALLFCVKERKLSLVLFS